MARLDSLPPDQRAVLQLLLKQGKRYDEIAAMLRIDAGAVRGRAMDALDALGPDDAAGLNPDQQDRIGDYLLGQQSGSEQGMTRMFLATSAPGRAWAQAVVDELRPLAGDALPEIMVHDARAGTAESASAAAGEETETPQTGPAREASSAGEETDSARSSAGRERPGGRGTHARSSRLGGVLLLAGMGVAIVVVLVLVLGRGGDKPGSSGASTATTSTAQAKVDAQINLAPPGGAAKGKPLGVVQVVSQGSQRGISIALQDLDKNTAYVFWLANSATDFQFLGFTPAVDKNGRVLTASKIPADAGTFKQLILTKETKRAPKKPGPIVLRGAFTLGAAG